MQPTPKVNISDTSGLVVLTKIGNLEILQKVYGEMLAALKV